MQELKAIDVKPSELYEKGEDLTVVALIEPSKFRNIDDLLKKTLKGI